MLDAVKQERRVAWMILSNANVHSLEDGTLTLRFTRDGDLKGFTTSGCDEDLKRVLSERFGLNVAVKGMVSTDAASGPPPSTAPARGSSSPAPGPAAPSPPVRRDPTPRTDGPPPRDSFEPDEPDDDPLPPGPPELTGMDLIRRELGAQIISEIEG